MIKLRELFTSVGVRFHEIPRRYWVGALALAFTAGYWTANGITTENSTQHLASLVYSCYNETATQAVRVERMRKTPAISKTDDTVPLESNSNPPHRAP